MAYRKRRYRRGGRYRAPSQIIGGEFHRAGRVPVWDLSKAWTPRVGYSIDPNNPLYYGWYSGGFSMATEWIY